MPEQTPPNLEPAPKEADCFRILFYFFGRQAVPVSPTLSQPDGQPELRERLLDSVLGPVFDLPRSHRESILQVLTEGQPKCDPASCDQATFQTWLDELPRSHRDDILGQLLFGPWDPEIDEAARKLSSNGKLGSKGVKDSAYAWTFYGSSSEHPSLQDLTSHVLQLLLNCLADYKPDGWPEEMWQALVARQPAYARLFKPTSLLEGIAQAMEEAVKAAEEANASGAKLPPPNLVAIGWNYLKNEEKLRLKTKKRRKPRQASQTNVLTHTDHLNHCAVSDPTAHDNSDFVEQDTANRLDRKKQDFRGRVNNTRWQSVFGHQQREPQSGADTDLKRWAKKLLAELMIDEEYWQLKHYQHFLGISASRSLWATDLVREVLLRNGDGERILPDGTLPEDNLSESERSRRSRRLKKEERLFALRTYDRIVQVRKTLREEIANGGMPLSDDIVKAIWDHSDRLVAILHDYCRWSKHLAWEDVSGFAGFPNEPASAFRDELAEQIQQQTKELEFPWNELQQRLPKTDENQAFWNVLIPAQLFVHLLVAAFVRVGSERQRRTKIFQSPLKGFEWLLEQCWSVEDTSKQAKFWDDFWSSLT